MVTKSKRTNSKMVQPTRNCTIKGVLQKYRDLEMMSDIGSLPTGNKMFDISFNKAYNKGVDVLVRNAILKK